MNSKARWFPDQKCDCNPVIRDNPNVLYYCCINCLEPHVIECENSLIDDEETLFRYYNKYLCFDCAYNPWHKEEAKRELE